MAGSLEGGTMRVYIYAAAILILCTGNTLAKTANPPDYVRCQGGVSDATTSSETFDAWIHHYQLYDATPPEQETLTHATDAMTLDLTSSKYFRGHIGGGGGTFAMYDARHRVLAYCQLYDTAQGLFLAGNIGPPPFPVVRGDLSGFASRSGLRLGSTISDVRHVYGPAPIVYVKGKPELRYSRSVQMSEESPAGISTSFVFVNGKVAQIARISGH
jgi:hypothetical protein